MSALLVLLLVSIDLTCTEDPLHYLSFRRPREKLMSKKWIPYVEKFTEKALQQDAIKIVATSEKYFYEGQLQFDKFLDMWMELSESLYSLKLLQGSWLIAFETAQIPNQCLPQNTAENIFNTYIRQILRILNAPIETTKYVKSVYQNIRDCITYNKVKEIAADPLLYLKQISMITSHEFSRLRDQYCKQFKESAMKISSKTLAMQFKVIKLYVRSQIKQEHYFFKVHTEDGYERYWEIKDTNITSVFPLYSILVPEYYRLEKIKFCVYKWEFRRHPMFRTKVLFHDLKIYGMFGFYPFNVTVSTTYDYFAFHGLLSNFSLYPNGNVFWFIMFFGKIWYFKLNVFFDLISVNVATTYKVMQNKYSTQQWPTLSYCLETLLVSIYHIQLRKSEIAVINVTLTEDMHCQFFDGPGYEVTNQVIKPAGTKVVASSTFQCLLHFVSFVSSHEDSKNTFNFLFHAEKLQISDNISVQIHSYHSLNISNNKNNNTFYTLLNLPSLETKVNITLLKYDFKGIFTTECIYGGIYFLEYVKNVEIEVRSFCYSGSLVQVPGVYLNGSQAAMILYGYHEYVSINIKLSISTAKCEVVQLHVCEANDIQPRRLWGQTFISYLGKQSYNFVKASKICDGPTTVNCFEATQALKTHTCTVLQMTNDPLALTYNSGYIFNSDSPFCIMFLDFGLEKAQDTEKAFMFTVNGFLGMENEFSVMEKDMKTGNELSTIYSSEMDHVCWWKNTKRPQQVGCSHLTHTVKCNCYFKLHLIHHNQKPFQKDSVHFGFLLQKWIRDKTFPAWFDIFITLHQEENSKEKLYLREYASERVSIANKQHKYLILFVEPVKSSLSNKSLDINVLSKKSLNYHVLEVKKRRHTDNYTSSFYDSVLSLKNTLIFHKETSKVLLAVQGMLEDIQLKSDTDMIITAKWIGNEHSKFKLSLAPFSPQLHQQFHKYLFLLQTSGMSNTPLRMSIQTKQGRYIFIKYTGANTRETSFSWKEASHFCSAVNAQLPQFLSKKEQEEFLLLVKKFPALYVFEALFINLNWRKQKMRWNFLHPVSFQQFSNINYGYISETDEYKLFAMHTYLFPQERIYCKVQEQDTFNSERSEHKINARQSKLNNTNLCTILITRNLVEPRWVLVDCFKYLLDHVICFRNEASNTMQIDSKSQIFTCRKSEIIIGEKCYHFGWYENINFANLYPKCSSLDMTADNLKNITKFFPVFRAIRLDKMTFVSIKNRTILKEFLLEKYWYHFDIQHKLLPIRTNIKGFYICQKDASVNLTTPHMSQQVFHCKNKRYISKLYICNQVYECNEDSRTEDLSDEEECTCTKKLTSHCKQMCINATCTCSPLFYKLLDGNCKPFVKIQPREKCKWSPHNAKEFVKDCQVSSDSKLRNKHFPSDGNFIKCHEYGQLPCHPDHSQCYNFAEICIYRLNNKEQLIPCVTGSHVEECEMFECNGHFKCPNYYCIPWRYTCDGKWDCPYGYDESVDQCGMEKACENMFKCSSSQICLHILDICDGYFDCPFNDDEMLCGALGTCPTHCLCLHSALFCRNISIDHISSLVLPFLSVHIVQSNVMSISFLRKNTKVHVLNLSDNNISDICVANPNFAQLQILDLSFNILNVILKMCLFDLKNLKTVNFHWNKLVRLEQSSFANLENLALLDLSKNKLSTLHKDMFKNINYLRVLNLIENMFLNIYMDMFEGFKAELILTDNYKICCMIFEVDVICTSDAPWYSKCDPGISDVVVGILAVFSLLIIILNVLSFCLSLMTKGPVKVITGVSNFSDSLCAVHLLIIWGTDSYFDSSFLVNELQWRESVLCTLSFTVVVVFNFTSLYLSCLVSYARLMVTLYPLDSQFRKKKVMLKCLLLGISILVALSVIFVFTYKQFERAMSTVLCSPFIDPSGSLWNIFLTAFIFIGQVAAIVFLCITYTLLVQKLKESEKNVRKTGKETKRSFKIIIQVLVLITSYSVSWIPSSLIYLSALFMTSYPWNLPLWPTLFVVPLSSLINPLIFIRLNLKQISDSKKDKVNKKLQQAN